MSFFIFKKPSKCSIFIGKRAPALACQVREYLSIFIPHLILCLSLSLSDCSSSFPAWRWRSCFRTWMAVGRPLHIEFVMWNFVQGMLVMNDSGTVFFSFYDSWDSPHQNNLLEILTQSFFSGKTVFHHAKRGWNIPEHSAKKMYAECFIKPWIKLPSSSSSSSSFVSAAGRWLQRKDTVMSSWALCPQLTPSVSQPL